MKERIREWKVFWGYLSVGFWMRCSLLSLGHLNTWSSVSAVWGVLRGVTLPEELCHCGWALSFQKTPTIWISSLGFPFVAQDVNTHFCSSCLLFDSPILPSWTLTPWSCEFKINPSFYKLPWSWCFITAIEKKWRYLGTTMLSLLLWFKLSLYRAYSSMNKTLS